MPTLATDEPSKVFEFLRTVHDASAQSRSLEAAAQSIVDMMTARYPQSVVLARAYGVLPYQSLSAETKRWADDFAAKNSLTLDEKTRVFTLLGTRGAKPEWCDRRRSKGHVAIPLVSSAFVQAVPMLARVASDLGLDLAARERGGVQVAAAGGTSKLFFVPDASTTVDDAGRKVIPAQDFVAEQGVRTVFGAGTTYTDGPVLLFIFFTKEKLERLVADRFGTLASMVKAGTQSKVRGGVIFS